jgi:hypothetical protein
MFKEKLEEIRYYGGFGYSAGSNGFEEYMNKLKPHAVIIHCKLLISVTNDGNIESTAVRNPADHNKAILIEAEYAG